jgi:iron complex outermembrane recepter protein
MSSAWSTTAAGARRTITRPAATSRPRPRPGGPGGELPLDEVGSSAYKTQDHGLNLALQNDRNLLELSLGYQDMSEQLFPNQRMDMFDNEQWRANLAWTRELERGVLELRTYHEDVDHFMDFGQDKRFWYGANTQPPTAPDIGTPCDPIRFAGDPAGTCAAGMPMYSEGRTTGVIVKSDIDLSVDQLLRTGIEYQRYRLDDYWTPSGGNMGPGTFLNINNGKRDRWRLTANGNRSSARPGCSCSARATNGWTRTPATSRATPRRRRRWATSWPRRPRSTRWTGT